MITEGDKILRTQAWDFFTVVASQRLTVINFYIAIATLLAGGQIALLQNTQYLKAGTALGVLLVVLSFIFWKWDRRSSDLIKLAEETLMYYESRIEIGDASPEGHTAQLITRECQFTKDKKKKTTRSLHCYFTYRVCLNLLYWMFSSIGIVVALLCIIK